MKNFVDPYYQGQTKVNYSYDEKSGEIREVHVGGWEPEFDSTERAWEEIRAELEVTRKKVLSGEVSVLAFHMKKRMMDSKLLAEEAGVCHFFAVRHLNSPSIWKNLKVSVKEKYAAALGLSLQELEALPELPDGK